MLGGQLLFKWGKKKSLHKMNGSLRSLVIGEKQKNSFTKFSVHPTALS
jgi:hypothetical protein